MRGEGIRAVARTRRRLYRRLASQSLTPLQSNENRFKNTVQIVVDLFVEKPLYEIAARGQKASASGVVRKFLIRRMRCAIEFNDEFLFATNEIRDVGTDGLLTREFVAIQTTVAKASPKSSLGLRLRTAQRSCAFGLLSVGSTHLQTALRPAPHPNPLPRAGEGIKFPPALSSKIPRASGCQKLHPGFRGCAPGCGRAAAWSPRRRR